MKKSRMIIAIVVSLVSAQGLIAQDELAESDAMEYMNYQYEVYEYTEIGMNELPILVQQAVVLKFNNLHIHKTYLSKDNTYKVVLKGENNFTKIVFLSAKGTWIKPDNKS